jgi:DNA-binding GntR family transcriptional regulator
MTLQMINSEVGKTLVEGAYAELRRDIIDGTFGPGARLRTDELRARYNISGSTMREALTRLLGEALATVEGQRGFRVASASIEEFRDLNEVRKLVEAEALRQAIEFGDDVWEGQVVAAFHRLSKVEEQFAEYTVSAPAEFDARNHEFHNSLIAACPSPWLHRIIKQLFQLLERYRRMSAARWSGYHDIRAANKAIFEATLARNSNLACHLLGAYIDSTSLHVRSALEKNGIPIASGFPR